MYLFISACKSGLDLC